MAVPMKEVALQVLKNLAAELTGPDRKKVSTKGQVKRLIDDNIKKAFYSVDPKNRAELNTEIQELFIYTKLIEFNSDLATLLRSTKLISVARSLAEKIYFRLADFNSFWKDVFTNPRKALNTLVKNFWDNPLIDNLSRYIQPFKFVAFFITYTVLLSTTLPLIPLLLLKEVLDSSIRGVGALWSGFTDLVTGNLYTQSGVKNELSYRTNTIESLRKKEIRSLDKVNDSEEIERLKEMSPQTFLDFYMDKHATLKFPADVGNSDKHSGNKWRLMKFFDENTKKNASNHYFYKLKIQSIAFFNALTTFDKDSNFWLSLFLIKPLQLITSLFVLPLVFLTSLVRYALDLSMSLITTGIMALCYATFSVLNTPLAVYDAGSALMNCCKPSKADEASDDKDDLPEYDDVTNAAMRQLLSESEKDKEALDAANDSTLDENAPPGHFSSPMRMGSCRSSFSSTKSGVFADAADVLDATSDAHEGDEGVTGAFTRPQTS